MDFDSASPCADETCAACSAAPDSLVIDNRPGLSAIAYRVGTHAELKHRMLEALATSGSPTLAGLTTRDATDFSIALLDAWAVVGDVLTFYQERIANECFLRTATERLSVTELSRLIGYQPKPGVAATTQLAFTLDTAPGALGQTLSATSSSKDSTEPLPPIQIDVGTKVQSVPGPGEQAQTFETVERVNGRPEWNAMRPRSTRPQLLDVAAASLVLRGTATGLSKGDWLLLQVSATEKQPRRVKSVTVDNEAGTTLVELVVVVSPKPVPDKLPQAKPAYASISSYRFERELDGKLVKRIAAERWRAEDLAALFRIKGWKESQLRDHARVRGNAAADENGVYALRLRLGVFGCNAPQYNTLLSKQNTHLYPVDWDSGGFSIWKDPLTEQDYSARGPDLFLERSATSIVPGSLIVLFAVGSSSYDIFEVEDSQEASLVGFGMSGKATGLRLKDLPADKPPYFVRTTTVLAQNELLPLGELPVTEAVSGDSIELDGLYLGLSVGQRIVVSGRRSDLPGVRANEARELLDVVIEGGHTTLLLSRSLEYSYERASLRINGNVALATHGETVQEVLGSGDASQPLQTFSLRQPPLTYVPAETPSGARSTLEVRVNDVLWHEVPALYDQGPEDRVYTTSRDDAQNTTIVFGDGQAGARPATGQQNITARYRRGLGLSGMLAADQLSQLLTRPLGVQSVTNPLAPVGAEDPESLRAARRNAPLKVLTLNRIVSLKDYASFAAGFSGIAKALATWSWYGQTRGVFLTVAGANGALVADGGDLQQLLLREIAKVADPNVQVVVRSYEPAFFRFSATLRRRPDYSELDVRARVERALRERYSFDARSLGEPLHRSEVIGVIQNVRGVEAVSMSAFHRSDSAPERAAHLLARAPQDGDKQPQAAELLSLDPRPLDVEISV